MFKPVGTLWKLVWELFCWIGTLSPHRQRCQLGCTMQRILNYIPRASVRQTHTYQYRCLSTNSPPPPRLAKDLELLDIASETHRRPRNVGDWLAWGMAQFIVKGPLLWGFRKRYIHPAVCVETISGVHGMVAGMARHLKSLRRMRHDYGWTHLLLHEAENERVHLMIWMVF